MVGWRRRRAATRVPAGVDANRDPLGLRMRAPVDGDYPHVAEALGAWMPPERVARLLPSASLEHFADTSLVVEDADGEVVGLLVALAPASTPGVGYVHFVWVSPEWRGRGIGALLYDRGLALLRERGCRQVEAVTSSRNHGAIAFHEHVGFTVRETDEVPTAVPGVGPIGTVVVMTRAI
jgi:ribosomal protein S18 acetylase RimI-like enzyme